MENMREYLYNAIEIQKNTIKESLYQSRKVKLPVLVEFYEECIAKAEAKIEVYEEMLGKVLEQEKYGDVIPF